MNSSFGTAFVKVSMIASAGLLLAACGSPRRGEPIVGPLNLQSAAVERGQAVFYQHCHQCHPGGEGGLGPSLNEKPLPKFLVKRQVRWGLGVMPSFHQEHISDRQLDDLASYLVALRNAE